MPGPKDTRIHHHTDAGRHCYISLLEESLVVLLNPGSSPRLSCFSTMDQVPPSRDVNRGNGVYNHDDAVEHFLKSPFDITLHIYPSIPEYNHGGS